MIIMKKDITYTKDSLFPEIITKKMFFNYGTSKDNFHLMPLNNV